MTRAIRRAILFCGCVAILGSGLLFGHDWPQWRGPNRDAKATGFTVPATWPKTLTKKWSVTVGNGVATPALVGDRLYVFARRGGDEVIACLDANTGKELWSDKYAAKPASGAASRFPGPRSSPTVADGKVVTLGVRGTLSCLDAASGKVVWRKSDADEKLPRFFTSCSPIVVDGLCIVQFGGEEKGGIAAYDLTSGDEKWKWNGDGTAYASPDLLTIDGVKMHRRDHLEGSRRSWRRRRQARVEDSVRRAGNGLQRGHADRRRADDLPRRLVPAPCERSRSKSKATSTRPNNSGWPPARCRRSSTRRSSRTACCSAFRAVITSSA